MDLIKVIHELQERVKALEKQRGVSRTTYDKLSGDPDNPDTGKVILYFKSDGKLYYRREDGTVKEVATV